MDTLYKQNIIDHYKKPHNYGKMLNPDLQAKVENLACGDEIEIFIKFDRNNLVKDIKFEAHGCAISIATMSMLSDKLLGRDIESLKRLQKSEVLKLTGLTEQSGRVKCGLIAWEAVKKCLG